MRIRPRSTHAPTPSAAAGRPRHAFAALAIVAGLAAAGLAVPSSASAASGTPAASAADATAGASVVVPASVDRAAAAAHWTPAARAAALAADAPTVAGSGAASASASATLSASGDASAAAAPVPHPDQPFVGVLFFASGGRDHACTASVVATPAGDAIATAAHCLVDRRTGSATTLATFIPGAQGATAPHGIWPVRVAAVSSSWTATGRASDDAGFARVSGPAGEVLAASVGAAEPVFGSALVPATGEAPRLAILGYPAAGSASASLVACAGRPRHDAGGQTSLPCALGTGAAGSSVITAAGEQRSVVARPSAGRGVLLATWGADAQRALSSLQGR